MAHAMIVAVHFCEVHGPSVLTTTQRRSSFRIPKPSSTNHAAGSFPRDSLVGIEASSSFSSKSALAHLSDVGACLSSSPAVQSTLSIHGGSTPAAVDGVSSGSSCPACEVIGDDAALVTPAPDSPQHCYVTSRYPSSSFYSRIRRSCVRCLSCEFCPGREGPLVFGGEEDGYTLCYVFQVQDASARGLTRLFGLMVLMEDALHLAHSWTYLTRSLYAVVSHLQKRASVVFAKEQQKHVGTSSTSQSGRPVSGRRWSRFRRNTPGSARSLGQLVGDKALVPHLHQWFSVLLHRWAGFIASRHVRWHGRSSLPPATTTATRQQPAAHTVTFRTNQQLLHALGPMQMACVVHHVVTGAQVVVRGAREDLVQSMLACLAHLLPPECLRTHPYAAVYMETWQCNFLGLSKSAHVPTHVPDSHYVLIDVDNDELSSAPHHRGDGDEGGGSASPWTTYRYHVKGVHPTSAETSQLVREVLAVLELQLPVEVEQLKLRSLRERWASKSRLLWLARQAMRRDDASGLGRFRNALGCTNADISLLKFWSGARRSNSMRLVVE